MGLNNSPLLLRCLKLLWGLWLLWGVSAPAGAQKAQVRRLSAQVENDTLHLSFWLNFEGCRTSKSLSYTYTPVLRGKGYLRQLPAVVLTGGRRYRFDRREAYLTNDSAFFLQPYARLVGRKARRADSLFYDYRLPYKASLDQVALVLMSESKDCCRLNLLGIDQVAANLTGRPAVLVVDTAAVPVRQEAGSCVPCIPCIPMVSYLSPRLERVKRRTKEAVIRIDYPVNKYDVYPLYLNNAQELQKLDSLMPAGNLAVVKAVDIHGYASPEGMYINNEMLASNRAKRFASYMQRKYSLPADFFSVEWTPEDWDGLEEMLKRDRPPFFDEALDIIHTYGIFEGREAKLMELRGGTLYRRMINQQFMLLRRIVVKVSYDVREVTSEEAAALLHTDPSMLSLQEMYRLAWIYGPGTDEYSEVYETAARIYPDDPVANINAASAAIMRGDLQKAHHYLDHLKEDNRAWNNLGVLAMLEGDRKTAEHWFRKALEVEPEKAQENLHKLVGNNGKD